MGSIFVTRIKGSPLWQVAADYSSPKLKEACERRVPGMRWVSDDNHGHGEGFVDAVDHLVAHLAAGGIRVHRGRLPEGPSSEHMLPVAYKGLRDYQKAGADFCIANAPEGCILADDMSLGKTWMSLVVAHAFRGKTLVVCLSYVKGTWKKEIEKRFPKTKFQVLEGVKDPRAIDPQTELVVINYDILYAWLPFVIAWGVKGLIIDEMHVISNVESRRTKSVLVVRHVAKWCVGLSGTPMTNRPRDLYGAVSVICPGRFGTNFFPFGIMFCGGHQEDIEVRET